MGEANPCGVKVAALFGQVLLRFNEPAVAVPTDFHMTAADAAVLAKRIAKAAKIAAKDGT